MFNLTALSEYVPSSATISILSPVAFMIVIGTTVCCVFHRASSGLLYEANDSLVGKEGNKQKRSQKLEAVLDTIPENQSNIPKQIFKDKREQTFKRNPKEPVKAVEAATKENTRNRKLEFNGVETDQSAVHVVAKRRVLIEIAKLLLAVVPFRINTLAAAEVFPDYPSEISSKADSIIKIKFVGTIMRYQGFMLVPISTGFIVFLIFGLSKLTANTIRHFRRFMLSISSGLVMIALLDMLLDMIRLTILQNHQNYIFDIEQYAESFVFAVTFVLNLRISSFWQVAVSLLGSALIIVVHHFFEDGKLNMSFEFFKASTFFQEAKSELGYIFDLIRMPLI